jgi:protein-L-isoaspartate(D-aspartate) O-methyltransferase
MLKAYSTTIIQGISMEKNGWKKLVDNLMKEGILRSPRIINAMHSVPRAKFLPENMQPYSAEDTPLPIGFGQTVSAPHNLGVDAGLGETWSQ